jgi:hypothetical protein
VRIHIAWPMPTKPSRTIAGSAKRIIFDFYPAP